MESTATLRFASITPRKARLTADLVRGKPVPQAIAELSLLRKAAAPVIEKVVRSAAANAADKHGSDIEQLWVKEIFVNQGPSQKRFQTRAHGSASPLVIRSAHITVIVDDEKPARSKARKR
ncbi:MAG: 50S ribosomal protein L22 [Bdellovibrionota bacterium]